MVLQPGCAARTTLSFRARRFRQAESFFCPQRKVGRIPPPVFDQSSSEPSRHLPALKPRADRPETRPCLSTPRARCGRDDRHPRTRRRPSSRATAARPRAAGRNQSRSVRSHQPAAVAPARRPCARGRQAVAAKGTAAGCPRPTGHSTGVAKRFALSISASCSGTSGHMKRPTVRIAVTTSGATIGQGASARLTFSSPVLRKAR